MSGGPGTELVCARHGTPTGLTCVECQTPICPTCAIRTPVGFKCPDHAWKAKPRKSRKGLTVLVSLVVIGGGLYAVREVSIEKPFTATCPTRAGPDVGIGPEGGGTTWKELARSPLCGRFGAASAWTGKELLIWGGQNCAGAECPSLRAPRVADGAAYDPARNSWWMLAAAPLEGRDDAATAWTGTELLVWGGHGREASLPDGAAYDPARDRWRPIAGSPLGAVGGSASAWTGTELLVWGGDDRTEGAAYNPATDSWRPMAPAPIAGRTAPVATWTGRELLVWGGSAAGSDLSDGTAYDPATDSWRSLPFPALGGRVGPASVWTGRELLVWGGSSGNGVYGDGAAYSPTTDRWRSLPPAPVPPRADALAVWSGRELLMWGGLGPAADSGSDGGLAVGPIGRRLAPDVIVPRGDGAAYNPDTNSWRRLEQVALLARRLPVGAWDGKGMIVWGGVVLVESPASAADGARYTPR